MNGSAFDAKACSGRRRTATDATGTRSRWLFSARSGMIFAGRRKPAETCRPPGACNFAGRSARLVVAESLQDRCYRQIEVERIVLKSDESVPLVECPGLVVDGVHLDGVNPELLCQRETP